VNPGELVLKIAAEPGEFEQIHRLNYQTFVEEIPQHAGNPERRLVDKFNHENTYLIALHDGNLVGMLAARDIRPFSLDQKLPDLDALLPPHRHVCEIRLLSIQPEWRNRDVLPKLLDFLSSYCQAHGYDLLIMSGTTLQARLYRHLGFLPFGPLVGTGDVLFQPMYLTLERADTHSRPVVNDLTQRSPR
jgi:GNAT superfamily N-acetyltransferase